MNQNSHANKLKNIILHGEALEFDEFLQKQFSTTIAGFITLNNNDAITDCFSKILLSDSSEHLFSEMIKAHEKFLSDNANVEFLPSKEAKARSNDIKRKNDSYELIFKKILKQKLIQDNLSTLISDYEKTPIRDMLRIALNYPELSYYLNEVVEIFNVRPFWKIGSEEKTLPMMMLEEVVKWKEVRGYASDSVNYLNNTKALFETFAYSDLSGVKIVNDKGEWLNEQVIVGDVIKKCKEGYRRSQNFLSSLLRVGRDGNNFLHQLVISRSSDSLQHLSNFLAEFNDANKILEKILEKSGITGEIGESLKVAVRAKKQFSELQNKMVQDSELLPALKNAFYSTSNNQGFTPVKLAIFLLAQKPEAIKNTELETLRDIAEKLLIGQIEVAKNSTDFENIVQELVNYSIQYGNVEMFDAVYGFTSGRKSKDEFIKAFKERYVEGNRFIDDNLLGEVISNAKNGEENFLSQLGDIDYKQAMGVAIKQGITDGLLKISAFESASGKIFGDNDTFFALLLMADSDDLLMFEKSLKRLSKQKVGRDNFLQFVDVKTKDNVLHVISKRMAGSSSGKFLDVALKNIPRETIKELLVAEDKRGNKAIDLIIKNPELSSVLKTHMGQLGLSEQLFQEDKLLENLAKNCDLELMIEQVKNDSSVIYNLVDINGRKQNLIEIAASSSSSKVEKTKFINYILSEDKRHHRKSDDVNKAEFEKSGKYFVANVLPALSYEDVRDYQTQLLERFNIEKSDIAQNKGSNHNPLYYALINRNIELSKVINKAAPSLYDTCYDADKNSPKHFLEKSCDLEVFYALGKKPVYGINKYLAAKQNITRPIVEKQKSPLFKEFFSTVYNPYLYEDIRGNFTNEIGGRVFDHYVKSIKSTDEALINEFADDIKKSKENKEDILVSSSDGHDLATLIAMCGSWEAFQKLYSLYDGKNNPSAMLNGPFLHNHQNKVYGSLITTALLARNLSANPQNRELRLIFVKNLMRMGGSWAPNGSGDNPLHIIAKFNDQEALQRMLEIAKPFDVHKALLQTNTAGETVFEILIKSKNSVLIDDLLAYCEKHLFVDLPQILSFKNGKGYGLGHIAAVYSSSILKNLLLFQKIINRKDKSVHLEKAKIEAQTTDGTILQMMPYDAAVISGNFDSFIILKESQSDYSFGHNRSLLKYLESTDGKVDLRIFKDIFCTLYQDKDLAKKYVNKQENFLSCNNAGVLEYFKLVDPSILKNDDLIKAAFQEGKILQMQFFVENGVDIFSVPGSGEDLFSLLVQGENIARMKQNDKLLDFVLDQVISSQSSISITNRAKMAATLILLDTPKFTQYFSSLVSADNSEISDFIGKTMDLLLQTKGLGALSYLIANEDKLVSDSSKHWIKEILVSNDHDVSEKRYIMRELIDCNDLDVIYSIIHAVDEYDIGIMEEVLTLEHVRRACELGEKNILELVLNKINNDVQESIYSDNDNNKSDPLIVEIAKSGNRVVYETVIEKVNVDINKLEDFALASGIMPSKDREKSNVVPLLGQNSEALLNLLEPKIYDIKKPFSIKEVSFMAAKRSYSETIESANKELQKKQDQLLKALELGDGSKVALILSQDKRVLYSKVNGNTLMLDYIIDNAKKEDLATILEYYPMNAVDKSGNTIAHKVLAITSDVQAVQKCIQKGASLILRGENGLTPYQLAKEIYPDKEELLKVLNVGEVREVSVIEELQKQENDFYNCIAEIAATRSAIVRKFAGLLSDYKTSNRGEIFDRVVRWVYSELKNQDAFKARVLLLQQLLDNMTDLSIKNGAGNNIMHALFSVMNKAIIDEGFEQSFVSGNVEPVIESILKNKFFDKNMLSEKNVEGFTPLGILVMGGSSTSLDCLFSKKGNTDYIAESCDMDVLFKLACAYNNADAVQYFSTKLDKYFSISSIDQNGWSALQYALYNGHTEVAKSLIKDGAIIDQINAKKQTLLQELLNKIYVQAESNTEISNIDIDALGILIENGADLMHKDEDAFSAFDVIRALSKSDPKKFNTSPLITKVVQSWNSLIQHQSDIEKDLIKQDILTFSEGRQSILIDGISKNLEKVKRIFGANDPSSEVLIKGNRVHITTNGNVNTALLQEKYGNDFRTFYLNLNQNKDCVELEVDKTTGHRNYVVRKGSIILTLNGVKIELLKGGGAKVLSGNYYKGIKPDVKKLNSLLVGNDQIYVNGSKLIDAIIDTFYKEKPQEAAIKNDILGKKSLKNIDAPNVGGNNSLELEEKKQYKDFGTEKRQHSFAESDISSSGFEEGTNSSDQDELDIFTKDENLDLGGIDLSGVKNLGNEKGDVSPAPSTKNNSHPKQR